MWFDAATRAAHQVEGLARLGERKCAADHALAGGGGDLYSDAPLHIAKGTCVSSRLATTGSKLRRTGLALPRAAPLEPADEYDFWL